MFEQMFEHLFLIPPEISVCLKDVPNMKGSPMRDFSAQIEQLTEQLIVAGLYLVESLNDPEVVQAAPIHHRAAAAAVVDRFLDHLSKRKAPPIDWTDTQIIWDFGEDEPEDGDTAAGMTDPGFAPAPPVPPVAPEPQPEPAAAKPYSPPNPASPYDHGLRPGIPHTQVQPYVRPNPVANDPAVIDRAHPLTVREANPHDRRSPNFDFRPPSPDLGG